MDDTIEEAIDIICAASSLSTGHGQRSRGRRYKTVNIPLRSAEGWEDFLERALHRLCTLVVLVRRQCSEVFSDEFAGLDGTDDLQIQATH